jgi:FkbM family methyltransferase
MTNLDRAFGLARSLAIYHAIPGRQRRIRRLYRQFVTRGDLAFDVGAHAGNRTRALTALGCRVIALEPQPDFARLLHLLFRNHRSSTTQHDDTGTHRQVSSSVHVMEVAVGRHPGHASLSISHRTPTVTTLSSGWRDARAADPQFDGVRWNSSVRVPVTTIEALIDRFGIPAFIKIDVEGAEHEVLDGLPRAVRCVSFEYLPQALDLVAISVARLMSLGAYRFNWSPGESFQLASATWLTDQALLEELRTPSARVRSGDVYARLS